MALMRKGFPRMKVRDFLVKRQLHQNKWYFVREYVCELYIVIQDQDLGRKKYKYLSINEPRFRQCHYFAENVDQQNLPFTNP